jgi:hypothetical protein
MIDTFGTALAVPVAFLLMLLAPVVIEAQNPADRDAKEIADYRLTEPALAKYKQAVHKLQPLIAQLPQDCERENGSTSLKDMATRMDAIPGVKSALKAAGMTSREYLVFTWSVFQSGMAVLQCSSQEANCRLCENGKRQLLSRA